MEPNRKKRRQFWLGMLLSVTSLAVIFFFIRPAEILNALQSVRYAYLGLSILGILLFMIFRAVRWRFMLNNQVAWRQVFHIQNIGYMLTMILPFRLGDVARAVLIGNVPPVTLGSGVSTMVVERVLDLLFIVTLLPFTLAGIRRLPEWMQEAALASGIVALGAIVVLIAAANQRPLAGRLARRLLTPISFLNTERWIRRLDDLLGGLSSLTRFKDGFILTGLSLLVWLPIVLAYHSGLLAVNL
ncbi:MAG TPA: lysylphosphatidylglycerol synthase transmembrane domain-containing protein, partial [Anaerolineae bacterium]